eukprot:TRINITY_DN13483_c0_g1_i1.p1 TRINITY_DN13483_c0_g1~~TRINITY_DN13483_c0_g1_i1.p1  ORF type:complete len:206 (-),score=63.86 TRINITY_DN13483_c0_g1_i1:156-773(-)
MLPLVVVLFASSTSAAVAREAEDTGYEEIEDGAALDDELAEQTAADPDEADGDDTWEANEAFRKVQDAFAKLGSPIDYTEVDGEDVEPPFSPETDSDVPSSESDLAESLGYEYDGAQHHDADNMRSDTTKDVTKNVLSSEHLDDGVDETDDIEHEDDMGMDESLAENVVSLRSEAEDPEYEAEEEQHDEEEEGEHEDAQEEEVGN